MGKVPKNTFVCSEHFTKKDYILPDVPTKKRSLKKSAIPSQKLPISTVDKFIENLSRNRKKDADERRKRHSLREAKSFVGAEVEVESNSFDELQFQADIQVKNVEEEVRVEVNSCSKSQIADHDSSEEFMAPDGLITSRKDFNAIHSTSVQAKADHDYCLQSKSNPHGASRGFAEADHIYTMQFPTKDFSAQFSPQMVTRDIGVQVTPAMIDEKKFHITDFIHTDKQLNTLTGIPTFNVLHAIEKNVNCVKEKLNLDLKNHALTTIQIIVLIFIRFKVNVSFEFISLLFSISSKTCRSYYDDMLPLLAFIFKSVIVWPTKAEILKNMPKCFSKYKETRVVIDCTEIPVEKPKCLKCGIKIYSFYKSGETIKFLLGVTPSGLVSFISDPYGGRASDKAITDQSSLYSKLDLFDGIMADKGFLIEQECENNFIKLIRPPFLRNKTQFNKNESERTRGIAAARVHVERTIQRLKIFKIFKTRYSFRRAHQVEDIMIIISGIVNLTNPILADNKFSDKL